MVERRGTPNCWAPLRRENSDPCLISSNHSVISGHFRNKVSFSVTLHHRWAGREQSLLHTTGGQWWWRGETHMSLDQAVHKWSTVEVCLSKEQTLGLLCWKATAGTWLIFPSNRSCAVNYQMQPRKSHHNPVIIMQGEEESGSPGRLRRWKGRYWRDRKVSPTCTRYALKTEPRWKLSSKCAIIFISFLVCNFFQPAKGYGIIKKLKCFLVWLHFSLCLNSDAFQACNSLGS